MAAEVFKEHSSDFTHEAWFTRQEEYSACENSCVISYVALEGVFPSLQKRTPDDAIMAILLFSWI